MKRFEKIDIIKGLCMLVVAFGHSLPEASQIVDGSLLFYLSKAIHSSILPLFFFISGLVSVKCLYEVSMADKIVGIKKRAVRMLVPYFSWALLFIPLRIIFAEFARFKYDFSKLYTIFLGNNPCGQLWFLYVMFLFSVTAVLFATRKNIKYLLAVSLIISLVSHFINLNYDSISWSNSLFLFFFYYLGLFVSTNVPKLFSHMKPGLFILAVIVYAVMLWVISSKLKSGFEYRVCRFVISIATIYLTLYISDLIHRFTGKTKVSGFLQEIGRYSMDIYVLHSPIGVVLRILLINILSVDRIIYMSVYVLIGIFGSYLISRFIVRKIPLFGFLFLGIPIKKKT